MYITTIINKCLQFFLAGQVRVMKRGALHIDWSSSFSTESEFEGMNFIKRNSYFSGKLGYGTYIGPNCNIGANIGRFSSVAPYVTTNHGVHPYTSPFVSTSPFFFSVANYNGPSFAKKQMFEEIKPIPNIGNDCWIGQGCFIAGGVQIGDGAVVLAGAHVVEDVPPYAIVGGVPAKIIRYRYDERTIKFLLKSEWWNMDVHWLQEHWMLLNDIDSFIAYFQKEKNIVF